MVLRDDPVATNMLRSQIGVMFGPEADLTDVASFLGETPPAGMDQAEFDIRVAQMRDSLKPKKESFLELRSYVSEAIAELRRSSSRFKRRPHRLEQAAGGAAVDSTPAGTRLMNYILANEKGCDAAGSALESKRKPDRPGPKSGPKKPEADPAAAAPRPEPPPEPAAVAADEEDTTLAEVPAGDAATRRRRGRRRSRRMPSRVLGRPSLAPISRRSKPLRIRHRPSWSPISRRSKPLRIRHRPNWSPISRRSKPLRIRHRPNWSPISRRSKPLRIRHRPSWSPISRRSTIADPTESPLRRSAGLVCAGGRGQAGA